MSRSRLSLSAPRAFQRLATALCAVILFTAFARADQPALVGSWGDPAKLDILGAVVAKPADIVLGLASDCDLQSEAAPGLPLERYLSTLRQRTEAGYKHMGFRNVRVDCQTDAKADKLRVKVVEGERFRCGAIHVVGATRVPTDKLAGLLREESAPPGSRIVGFQDELGKPVPRWVNRYDSDTDPNDRAWPVGDLAHFDDGSRFLYSEKIAQAFDELGFPAVKFDFDLEVDQKTSTAVLVIHVLDEGPGPSIAKVRAEGNRINSEKMLADYLGVKKRTQYSAETIAEWQRRLWLSGRFASSNIEVGECAENPAELLLRIEVNELRNAPSLDKPLTPEQTALLKCREWLAGMIDRGDDFVVEAPGLAKDTKWEIIYSRQALLGVLAESKLNADGSLRLRHAFLVEKNRLVWYSFSSASKLVLPLETRDAIILSIGIDVEAATELCTTKLGVGLTRFAEGDKHPPLKMRFTVAPAAFLNLSCRGKEKVSVNDGRLTVCGAINFVADAASGRMLGPMGGGDRSETLSLQQGKLVATRKQIELAAEHFPDRFDPRRPATSIAAMVVDSDLVPSVTDELPWNPKVAAVLHKLLERSALAPLDEWLAIRALPRDATKAEADDDFWLGRNSQRGVGVMLAEILLPFSSDIFSYGTWPWTIGREFALGLAGKDRETWDRLLPLYDSPSTGPVCCMLAAMVSEFGEHHDNAAAFAWQGTHALDITNFRNDYRPLLDVKTLTGKQVFAIARALRTLSADDVELLWSQLPNDDAKALRDTTAKLRERPESELAEAISGALDVWWEDSLRNEVKAAFAAIMANKRDEVKPADAAN